MDHHAFRQIFIAVVVLGIYCVFVLWSFNVLSGLYDGPQAQYKHAIAAIGLLLISKWKLTNLHRSDSSNCLTPRRGRRSESDVHEG